MAAKPPIKPLHKKQKTLIISPFYTQRLLEIAEYGYELFGVKVSDAFISKIESKVMTLPKMPDIHPKNHFIESNEKKIYRNILVGKYIILYSVTTHTIHVITIYHSAINPETIKTFIM
ncbi:MAG: type II toxin-antitoxin system RelE/ParE family toxin [Tannerella sp.]|jgi:plasmid stabilization system protein ParE|nr:type II toxin-antitoxin system RelE/ParE family toxin [Tannerella sp.]